MSTAGPEGIDPHRVFALGVGIEPYEISHDWDLPGAARDALQITEWLTDIAGVPGS
ncbi:hypothetical protein [Streptomyces coffeae]|uniref:Uncharacterized protein n=1 Tax=Streptomyces coffeae TaxID=621382 RepID=A0ABS1NCI6_9ACTN|nr:hypothetical protein [Streptomyces coffeae]MBL1097657.1 hypothetical protein [Streptomyces coffeae]